jgi:tRNA dimethylallyltransferase
MQEKPEPLLIIVAGPTAVGKTAIGIQLAKKLETSIINADSRQVFHEMRIGTSMPSEKEQAEVKHYFLGHRSVSEGYDASKFEKDVTEFLNKWFSIHSSIVMVGGSGLYIDAVCRGIDDLPSADPSIRQLIKKEYEKYGIEHIRKQLSDRDPAYFEIVDLNNPQRILKALEIFEMTGKPYSSFLTGKAKQRNFKTLLIGLDLPRHELHDRINKRVDSMIADGLVDEVKTLLPFRNLNSLNTVGYKELFEYLEGKYTFDEAVERIKAHTRQYARRQLTWFRRYPQIRWFHPMESNKIWEFLRNPGIHFV